jgi:hypothetical protein
MVAVAMEKLIVPQVQGDTVRIVGFLDARQDLAFWRPEDES